MAELRRFRELEEELEERLLQVRLIFELGLTREQHEDLKSTLRAVTKQWGGPKVVGLHYPAIYATSLTFTGLYELHSGEFWNHVPKLIKEDVPERGPAFVDALNRLGLETFQGVVDREPTQQYIMRILAHGGIPHDYLDKFSDLLVEEVERGRSDPESLLAEWSVNRARLEHLQKATQRFLLDGGEPAVDFLARCLATLEEGTRTGTFPASDLAGLSGPVVEALKAATEGKVSRGERAIGVAAPRLELDPYGDLGPHLLLPALMDRKPGHWTISSGGDLPTRHSGTSLRDTVVPVPPSDTYRVTYDTGRTSLATWEFSGPSSRGAFVFNPQTSQHVASHGTIALDAAHLVVPRSTEIYLERSEPGSDHSDEIGNLPELTGEWSDWKQVHVDLRGVERLQLVDENGHITIPVVPPRSRPELASEPVEAVTDDTGSPVFSRAPVVRLPLENEHGTWRVRLIDPDGLERHFEVPVTASEIDIAEHCDPGMFGTYSLVVQGPLGSDMRAVFTVAPGLVLECPDQVWLPTHGVPEVQVLSDASINGAPAGELVAVDFADDSSSAELSLLPESGVALSLRVHVDRLLWTVSHATKAVVPQDARPIRIGREEFEDQHDDLLLLSTGRDGIDVRLQLWEDGEVSQQSRLATTRGREGRWKFDLAPFSDRIRHSEAASLELRLAIEGESVLLAAIVAKTVPTKANAERDAEGAVVVMFEKTREVAGIEARFWSRSRPWARPISANVSTGSNLVNIGSDTPPGRYMFELTVPNDWSIPKRPDPLVDEVLELQIDGDDDYRRYLDSLGQDDPDAILERVLAGWKGAAEPQAAASADTLAKVSEHAGIVSEEILRQDGPGASASKLDLIVNLFWGSDASLAKWLVDAVEGGAMRQDAIAHISLCVISRDDEYGAKWDPIDPGLLERLWLVAPVVAAFFDVPYARSENDAKARCREHLGWVPGIDPDRSGGQLTLDDIGGARASGRGRKRPKSYEDPANRSSQEELSDRPETKHELRGLMSRDNLRLATHEWLASIDERQKELWVLREADLAKRRDLLASGTSAQRRLWTSLNSRSFPRGMGIEIEGWMDLPATVMSDALSAAGLLDQKGRRDRRAITKLHQAIPTARRLVEHDLILAIILRNS